MRIDQGQNVYLQMRDGAYSQKAKQAQDGIKAPEKNQGAALALALGEAEGVVVSIDQDYGKESSFEEEMKARQAEIETMKRQLAAAEQQAKAQAEEAKRLLTCLQIASRIVSGDKVPSKDHQYLLENQPGLYMRAISLRLEKANPKEYKRLSEDEESESTDGGGEVKDAAEVAEVPAGESNAGNPVDGSTKTPETE